MSQVPPIRRAEIYEAAADWLKKGDDPSWGICYAIFKVATSFEPDPYLENVLKDHYPEIERHRPEPLKMSGAYFFPRTFEFMEKRIDILLTEAKKLRERL